jgi:hypothetical protein
LKIATLVLILHAFSRWHTDCTYPSVSAKFIARLRHIAQTAVEKDGTHDARRN